jgi:hypothetical protein
MERTDFSPPCITSRVCMNSSPLMICSIWGRSQNAQPKTIEMTKDIWRTALVRIRGEEFEDGPLGHPPADDADWEAVGDAEERDDVRVAEALPDHNLVLERLAKASASFAV